jgi:hypothetical protein
MGRGARRIALLALLSILILSAVIKGFSKLTEFLSVIPADFSTIISTAFWTIIAILTACLAAVYVTVIGVTRFRRERAREAATRKARAVAEAHLASLVRSREQLVQKGPNGKPLLDEWTKEIACFVANHIRPTLTRREQLELDKDQENIAAMINTRVQVERAENPSFETLPYDTAATVSPSEEVWYYADAEEQVGPLSLDELRSALATYSNAKEVFVWCDRFPDWKQAGEVPELKLALRSRLRQVRLA